MQRAAIFMQADVHRAELQRDAVLVQPHINLARSRTRDGSRISLVQTACVRLLKGIQGTLPEAAPAHDTYSHPTRHPASDAIRNEPVPEPGARKEVALVVP